jgi:hypothetical protein
MGRREGVRFVRLDLGAVCAAEVFVQLAEEASFLGVDVGGGSLVLAYVVGVRGRQVPEVQQRSAGDGLSTV